MPNHPTTKSGRLSCCAPFCGRTVANDRDPPYQAWICQRHWMTIPEKFRRLSKRLERKHAAALAEWRSVPSPTTYRDCSDAVRRASRAWERCRAEMLKRIGDTP